MTLRLARDGRMQVSEIFISCVSEGYRSSALILIDMDILHRARVDKEGWMDVLTSPAEGQWTRRYARLAR